MFTGIIEILGTVRSVRRSERLARLVVEAPGIGEGVRIGDSIAVNGVCLTVTGVDDPSLVFDAVRETLDRSALGDLEPGDRVHLERAMRADSRLDGHIVQGHVDATGRIARVERQGDDVRLFVDCPPEFASELVEKGSVAIDGVSLTVVGVGEAGFDVVLVPHTLEQTTLAARGAGARVNLEADVLGKYVKRYLERVIGPQTPAR